MTTFFGILVAGLGFLGVLTIAVCNTASIADQASERMELELMLRQRKENLQGLRADQKD